MEVKPGGGIPAPTTMKGRRIPILSVSLAGKRVIFPATAPRKELLQMVVVKVVEKVVARTKTN